MSVYKILQTGGHDRERRSGDVGSVSTENDQNSSSPRWQDNDSDNASDHKSKSTAIPAISLIKDFFGNHEKNEELEDITLANSSHNNWLALEESFEYSNFSLKSPFLVDTAHIPEATNKSGDSQDVQDKGGGGAGGDGGGGGGGGVSSAVYKAVHDAVTKLLTNNDIESDLVSKLHHLLGG